MRPESSTALGTCYNLLPSFKKKNLYIQEHRLISTVMLNYHGDVPSYLYFRVRRLTTIEFKAQKGLEEKLLDGE